MRRTKSNNMFMLIIVIILIIIAVCFSLENNPLEFILKEINKLLAPKIYANEIVLTENEITKIEVYENTNINISGVDMSDIKYSIIPGSGKNLPKYTINDITYYFQNEGELTNFFEVKKNTDAVQILAIKTSDIIKKLYPNTVIIDKGNDIDAYTITVKIKDKTYHISVSILIKVEEITIPNEVIF